MFKPLMLVAAASLAAPLVMASPAAAQHHGYHRHDDHRRHSDHRRDGWRDYRHDHRDRYRRGNWHAPFHYHRFRAGIRIAPSYYGRRYYIANPSYYRLPPAGPYRRWVRHYNDVLLIDVRTGYVLRVLHDFYW